MCMGVCMHMHVYMSVCVSTFVQQCLSASHSMSVLSHKVFVT